MISDLERLVAIEDIKTMRSHLFEALDHRDFDRIRSLVTEDLKLLFVDDSGRGNPDVSTDGVDAFCDFVKMYTGTGNMVHLATMPRITVLDGGRAKGSWLVEGCLAADEKTGAPLRSGFETIDDEYVRVGGEWRVASIHARIKIASA